MFLRKGVLNWSQIPLGIKKCVFDADPKIEKTK